MTPLWSLQVEEQFYLTFPFLVAVLPRKALARVLIASVFAALMLRVGLVFARPANITGTYVLMPCRMDSLAMGGLIAIARRDFPETLRGRWVGFVTVVSAAVVAWICWKYGPSPWSSAMRTVGFSAADIAFTGILVLLIVQRRPFLIRLCRMRAAGVDRDHLLWPVSATRTGDGTGAPGLARAEDYRRQRGRIAAFSGCFAGRGVGIVGVFRVADPAPAGTPDAARIELAL